MLDRAAFALKYQINDNVSSLVPHVQINNKTYAWFFTSIIDISPSICYAFWVVIMPTNTPIQLIIIVNCIMATARATSSVSPTLLLLPQGHMWPRVAWPQTRPQPTAQREHPPAHGHATMTEPMTQQTHLQRISLIRVWVQQTKNTLGT